LFNKGALLSGTQESLEGDDMAGSDLFTGTLDLVILRVLQWQPMHGYAVGRWIRDTTEGVLDVDEGALYPALHRLERDGLVTSKWGRTEKGRRARYYALTMAGRERLAEETRRWNEHSGAVSAVLSAQREAGA
jgi:transcriptional regulator